MRMNSRRKTSGVRTFWWKNMEKNLVAGSLFLAGDQHCQHPADSWSGSSSPRYLWTSLNIKTLRDGIEPCGQSTGVGAKSQWFDWPRHAASFTPGRPLEGGRCLVPQNHSEAPLQMTNVRWLWGSPKKIWEPPVGRGLSGWLVARPRNQLFGLEAAVQCLKVWMSVCTDSDGCASH